MYFGLMSARACARSTRSPLGTLLNVGGKSEMRVNQACGILADDVPLAGDGRIMANTFEPVGAAVVG